MSKVHFRPADFLAKPAKPYPEFPLFAHNNGCWAKTIRGSLHYFGPWSEPDAALAKYLAEKDALHAGRKPWPDPAALTVKDACNAYWNAKQGLVDGGELAARTWQHSKEVCDLLVSHLGKSRLVSGLVSEDYSAVRRKMAKRWDPTDWRTASSTPAPCSSTPSTPTSSTGPSGSARGSPGPGPDAGFNLPAARV